MTTAIGEPRDAASRETTGMQTGPKPFTPYHKWDRTFFLTFAALSWIGIVMGFGPELHGHLKRLSPYPPPIIHLHAVAFTGWMVLFTAQIWLVRSRRLDIHRKLGLSAVALVPIMVVLGVAATIISRQVHFGAGRSNMVAYMIVPLTDMVLFPSFAIPALLFRKDAAAHKRLILLATASLLPAAFGRWIGPWILSYAGDGFFGMMAQTYLGSNLMILAAIIYDRVTRGRVHGVYFIAVPWMLAVQAITSAIYHWSGWMGWAQWMISR
jgi:hypothetical protein